MIKLLALFGIIGAATTIVLDLFAHVIINNVPETTAVVNTPIIPETIKTDYIANFDYNYDYLVDMDCFNKIYDEYFFNRNYRFLSNPLALSSEIFRDNSSSEMFVEVNKITSVVNKSIESSSKSSSDEIYKNLENFHVIRDEQVDKLYNAIHENDKDLKNIHVNDANTEYEKALQQGNFDAKIVDDI